MKGQRFGNLGSQRVEGETLDGVGVGVFELGREVASPDDHAFVGAAGRETFAVLRAGEAENVFLVAWKIHKEMAANLKGPPRIGLVTISPLAES